MIVAVVIYGACYPAGKYSNPCALRLSWTGIHTRPRLDGLTTSRAVPLVCIQKATALRTRREPRGRVPLLADPLREIHTHR